MSCYRVTINSQGQKVLTPVKSREEFLALRNDPNHVRMIQHLREVADPAERQKLKRYLSLQFCYSCMPNADGTLRGTKTPSNTFGMDVDHLTPEESDRVKSLVLEHAKEWGGVLMVERSVSRDGFHVVALRNPLLTQVENIEYLAQLLGVEPDMNAKDITRVFFATTGDPDDLLYLDDCLFVNVAAPVVDQPAPAPQTTTSTTSAVAAEGGAPAQSSTASSSVEPVEIGGFGIDQILAMYWQLFLGHEPQPGERNSELWKLAMNLRPALGDDKQKLLQAIPGYGLDGWEVEGIIDSALQKQLDSTGCPARLRQVLSALRQEQAAATAPAVASTPAVATAAAAQAVATAAEPAPAIAAEPEPEADPEADPEAALPQLPPLPKPQGVLRVCLSRCLRNGDHLSPMLANAAVTALAVYLPGTVRFRYLDGQLHESSLQCLAVGEQSSGKGSVDPLTDAILMPIAAADAKARERDDQYREQCRQARSAGTKIPTRPKDLAPQWLASDLSEAAYRAALRDHEASGQKKRTYIRLPELEGVMRLTSSHKMELATELLRKMFDCSAVSAERAGLDAVQGGGPARTNLQISTTFLTCQKLMRDAVHDGTVSRLVLSVIEPGLHSMPIFGDYDDAYQKALDPYRQRLLQAKGEVKCRQAQLVAQEIIDELEAEALAADDREALVLLPRAVVIAYRQAMVLYLAEGKWGKHIADFMRWSARCQLATKLLLFGAELRKARKAANQLLRSKPQPANLLALLPDPFTLTDMQALYRQNQKDPNQCSNTLRQWRHRNLVTYDEATQRYTKVKG